ncbi:MAG: metal ABC transporter substrate-binding protein, partial [Planctomycetota bacterium]
MTTSAALADITRNVGGAHVKVESLMRGPENVHRFKAKPSHAIKLRKADLFVHAGLDAEPWAPLLVKSTRQGRFLSGESSVDASRGVKLLEIPSQAGLTYAEGDIHVFGNPHYLLDLDNGAVVAQTIAAALSRRDPSHAEDYRRQLVEY